MREGRREIQVVNVKLLLSMKSWPAAKKVKGHLSLVSRQSRLSANDQGDNDMFPGAVHRSGIYLTADENPKIPQIGDRR